MNHYDVFDHPMYKYKAIKRGFSWPGFFFGIFWSLFNKLWIYSGWLFFWLFIWAISPYFFAKIEQNISIFVLSNLFGVLWRLIDILGPVIIWLVVGFKGNSWLRHDLAYRGFKFIGPIDSTSPDAAIALTMAINKKPTSHDDMAR